MSSNTLIENNRDRFKMVVISPVYAVLQYLKLLGTFERVHEWFILKFKVKENIKLVSLENCFKIQIFVEFFLENLP
jgi:hypothetical protein